MFLADKLCYNFFMQKEEILQILSDIKQEYSKNKLEKIGLFGSFAKENATPYSDVDIAIKKSDDFLKYYSSYEYFSFIETLKTKLQKAFRRKVDIFDLDSQSEIKHYIEKEVIFV